MPRRSAATSPSASATSALAAVSRSKSCVADRPVDPEQPLERAPVVDGQQEQFAAIDHDSAAAAALGRRVVVDQRLERRRHRCRALVLEDVAAEHHPGGATVEQVAGQGEHFAVVALGPAAGEVGHVAAHPDRPAHRRLAWGGSRP